MQSLISSASKIPCLANSNTGHGIHTENWRHGKRVLEGSLVRYYTTGSCPERLQRRPGVSAVQSSRKVSIYFHGTSTMPKGTRASSSSAKVKTAAEPRPSSSIILVSPTNQVLLLRRVKTSTSFASAHVFPGGNLSDFHDGAVPAARRRQAPRGLPRLQARRDPRDL